MSQNSPKERFHEVHGNDIMLYHDCTMAKRVKNTDEGLIFTARPVKIDEKISLKLVEVSEYLNDIIRIGFTSVDPSTLRYDLAKYGRNKLGLKGLLKFWMCSLSRRNCIKDTVLFFYVNRLGEIRYGINDEEKDSFPRNIPTDGALWAVIDIWSTPTTVQVLMDNKKNNHKNTDLLMFHACGRRNVEVSWNTAFKIDKTTLNTSYIFMEKPINFEEHIKVKILDVDMKQRNTLTIGFTSCDPSTLVQHHLPDDFFSFLDREEYWVILNEPSWNFFKNDEISFKMKSSGEMTIWKNDSMILKVVHLDPTLKLWAVFDISSLKVIEVEREVPNIAGENITESLKNDEFGKIKKTCEGNKGDGSECKICYENVIEAALYPCGHMLTCYQCAKTLSKNIGRCPLCRATIADVLKIYKT